MCPYIKFADRYRFDEHIERLAPVNPGELNYVITMLTSKYIKDQGESYQRYNDVIGALSCVQMELYRRRISSYEDKKIDENGDVF